MMKYNFVQISFKNNKIDVSFTSDGIDRVKTETYPNRCGFFCFPENMKKSEAFELLRKELIAGLGEEIEELCKRKAKCERFIKKLSTMDKDKYD